MSEQCWLHMELLPCAECRRDEAEKALDALRADLAKAQARCAELETRHDGPGTPTARWKALMKKLEERFPDPESYRSDRTPEEYYISAIDAMREELAALKPQTCEHKNIVAPIFDENLAKTMTVEEIRKRWPRVDTVCKDCGSYVIMYASNAHYVYGDW